jgi:predicted porin
MKKTLLALAVLGAFAGVASAQSSVTLSGSVDAGIKRQGVAVGTGTATANDWSMGGSQSSYNSFSLSGNEDLGGGTKAFFTLNHRFAIGTGTNNSPTNAPAASDPFWRVAFVGLGGGFGDIRLGRITMPLQDMDGGFDPFNTGTVASVSTTGIASTVRANNAIYYRSPSLGGLSVHFAVAGGDGQLVNGETGSSTLKYFAQPVKAGSERPIGGNIRYAAGPINVGLAFDKNTTDMKTAGLYASFDFGRAKLMTQYEKGDNFVSATTGSAAEKVKAFSVGLTAPVGAFLLRAGYLRITSDLKNVPATTSTGGQGDGAKFGIGADYNLSKRTNLYTSFGKWSGDRFSAATKKPRYDFGVTHRF